MMYRKGMTIIELLASVAILAVLVGLLLPAVQKVRAAAALSVSHNNMRQIILATHQFADLKPDQPVGNLPEASRRGKESYAEDSIFTCLLPFVHGPRPLPTAASSPDDVFNYFYPVVKIFRDPSDPSIGFDKVVQKQEHIMASYACNMTCFDQTLKYPHNMGDGTSSTIAYAQKYGWALRSQQANEWSRFMADVPQAPSSTHRASFADAGFPGDVLPVTVNGVTHASQPGRTFQSCPTVPEADSALPQSPHVAGLPTAFFDGSVRTLRPGIGEGAFWSLVTPNAGDIPGDY